MNEKAYIDIIFLSFYKIINEQVNCQLYIDSFYICISLLAKHGEIENYLCARTPGGCIDKGRGPRSGSELYRDREQTIITNTSIKYPRSSTGLALFIEVLFGPAKMIMWARSLNSATERSKIKPYAKSPQLTLRAQWYIKISRFVFLIFVLRDDQSKIKWQRQLYFRLRLIFRKILFSEFYRHNFIDNFLRDV